RRASPEAGHRLLSAGSEANSRAADDRGRGAADRPRRPALTAGAGGPELRARALQAPGGLRPGGGPGRPHHLHGADGEPAAVPLLPAPAPLRAELPRPPP